LSNYTKEGASMKQSISDSVGDPKRGAANRTDDVKKVQGCINIQLVKGHQSGDFLGVTGTMNDQTIAAIRNFQRDQRLPESGIFPDDDTWHVVSDYDGPGSMSMSQSGADAIKKAEGFICCVYNDSNHNATIGYGHLLHHGRVNDNDIDRWKGGTSQSDANNLFRADISNAKRGVTGHVEVPLTQNQFDALVSLVFNIGGTTFRNSTVCASLNIGDYRGAADAIEHERGDSTRRRDERRRFDAR
jgi:lysozyme